MNWTWFWFTVAALEGVILLVIYCLSKKVERILDEIKRDLEDMERMCRP